MINAAGIRFQQFKIVEFKSQSFIQIRPHNQQNNSRMFNKDWDTKFSDLYDNQIQISYKYKQIQLFFNWLDKGSIFHFSHSQNM